MTTTTATKRTRTKRAKPVAEAKTTPPAPTPKNPVLDFPAIRGIQAGREYYTTMIPLRLLSKLFVFEDEEMPAQMRAQRVLNLRRAKAITNYVLDSKRYVLNALTVTVDVPHEETNDFCFKPFADAFDIGYLQVPMSARFLLADGQHRAEGLKQALAENPDLKDETISVVLFWHTSLEAAQQMFHDLNNYTAKPSKSINLLYDHRTDTASITREVLKTVPVFRQYTDTERTSLTKNSTKLFTLNGLAEANQVLLQNIEQPQKEQTELAITFWQAVTEQIPDWTAILEKRRDPGEVRQELLSGHAITLVALGYLGQYLLRTQPQSWQAQLEKLDLSSVDWSKTNPEWNGRIIFGGRIHKNKATAVAMAQYLNQRPILSQAELERYFSDWLKHRYHEDVITNLFTNEPDSAEALRQEATNGIVGRFGLML